MPEGLTVFRTACDAAIAQLDDYLLRNHNAVRLVEPRGSPYFNKALAVWKINIDAGGESFAVAILVRKPFPFIPPEIHFLSAGAFLRFPHVDEFGKLCVTNAATTFSPRLVLETADFLLTETRELIEQSQAGSNGSEFILEFCDYWRRLPSFKGGRLFWSILAADGPTRLVLYYAASGFTIFAESEESLRSWLKNFNGGDLPKGFHSEPTVYLRLPEPLHPRNYPNTARDVLLLAQQAHANSEQLLSGVIPRKPGRLPLIIGFDTDAGQVLAGISIDEPTVQKFVSSQKSRNCRYDGYRTGHLPANLAIQRYFGSTRVSLFEVTRADAQWCLHRGGGEDFSRELFTKKIAILGCGSVGADVAGMLARAGVGNFVFVDDDWLSWGNVARHYLGGEHVGRNKASALAHEVSRQMPWVKTEAHGCSIEELLDGRLDVIRSCDLIVSTTADWSSDCMLNVACRTQPRMPPTVYGWTEAYGVSGHALAILNQGGCLACGMSEFGVFISRVSGWPDNLRTMRQATGCSDLFQPYTSVDTAPIKAMIAELALEVLRGGVRESTHRVWVSDLTRLRALGGFVETHWSGRIAEGQSDKSMHTNPWSINPSCPLCG